MCYCVFTLSIFGKTKKGFIRQTMRDDPIWWRGSKGAQHRVTIKVCNIDGIFRLKILCLTAAAIMQKSMQRRAVIANC